MATEVNTIYRQCDDGLCADLIAQVCVLCSGKFLHTSLAHMYTCSLHVYIYRYTCREQSVPHGFSQAIGVQHEYCKVI